MSDEKVYVVLQHQDFPPNNTDVLAVFKDKESAEVFISSLTTLHYSYTIHEMPTLS